jgi:hypothetical protein
VRRKERGAYSPPERKQGGNARFADAKDILAWYHSVSLSNVRPWNEFFQGFHIPEKGWQQVEKQVVVNLAYFAGNYLMVLLAIQLFLV